MGSFRKSKRTKTGSCDREASRKGGSCKFNQIGKGRRLNRIRGGKYKEGDGKGLWGLDSKWRQSC